MKQYEYKVAVIPTRAPLTTKGYEGVAQEFEAQLNELGDQGWEMIQRMDSLFFFKREKPEAGGKAQPGIAGRQ